MVTVNDIVGQFLAGNIAINKDENRKSSFMKVVNSNKTGTITRPQFTSARSTSVVFMKTNLIPFKLSLL